MVEARRVILHRLQTDLIGPSIGVEEEIDDRPSDRYLIGILFPQNIQVSETEDETIEKPEGGKAANQDTDSDKNVSLFRTMRPATAGISFAVLPSGNVTPSIRVRISTGTYNKIEENRQEAPESESQGDDEDETGAMASKTSIENNGVPQDETVDDSKGESTSRKKLRKRKFWIRSQREGELSVKLNSPSQLINLEKHGIRGLELFVRCLIIDGRTTVTVQAINGNTDEDGDLSRDELEELSFFQFSMSVETSPSCVFTPRPVRGVVNDEDAKTSSLIYRNAVEYATGHTCSAQWELDNSGVVTSVRTAWMPEHVVKSVDPWGDPIFLKTYEENGLDIPNAEFLAAADAEKLEESLRALTNAYSEWLIRQGTVRASLNTKELQKQADIHLERCREALERMNEGIDVIAGDPIARRSFQLANAAMQRQASWARESPSGTIEKENDVLVWRPFQLGFALMCLSSLVDPEHEDRSILDLIWFPTGGGKTEAYLLVAAFILFHRRLASDAKIDCYGTSVIMRYTLRTLTIQQFQRAAALICACEEIRNEVSKKEDSLGDVCFSIGLWVGKNSTPNNVKDAVEALRTATEATPKQIRKCPACNVDLVWEAREDESGVYCRCDPDRCKRSKNLGELPIMTVDEQIYKNPPSMLIGTIDKFAQIVRRQEIGLLFGLGNNNKPPDLIIQDELHLISGPLGTLAGIYETAIDHLCSVDGVPPKVIGSTATIRRASEQVGALFNRKAFQFPPPVIDEENSGFAKKDENSLGRLYVGITTAGRSDKYVLQAVCASLLQGVLDDAIDDDDRDPYGTLVAYFNSLRILGGALVAMQDDVTKSIAAFARRHNEKPRQLSEPEEMTSRKSSSEIPEVLEQLNTPFGELGSIDVLLASNMLSVGVDIPRLGLMVVNGQPKTMSEYIQATSRVGRQLVPGLVVTIYNNNKTRDRAHYETFVTWHSSIYRSIEATSVTPFAPRARDKALHAALIALTRHLIPGLSKPTLTSDLRQEVEDLIVPIILKRISKVDDRESAAAERQIERLLDDWEDRGRLRDYWNDYRHKDSLLISAEKAAARKASGLGETTAWETPNSMRNVESGVDFQLWESAELDRKWSNE